jgi:type 1 glutamine amidotransferase
LLPAAVSAADAPADGKKARILLVTGIDYPGHLWRQTAPVLAEAVRKDPRMEVFVVEDPAFLDSEAIHRYDAIFMHFMNWETPGPGSTARDNLRKFVEQGKGLVMAHFACGAWHGEWPEFARLAGRVWAGVGPEVRQHDPYGVFKVEILDRDHQVTRGLEDFETKDELYTCLIGEHPITVLAQAQSKVDGKHYPMAFVSSYGRGRTFQSVLGHDVQALSGPAVQELFRRGCAWAAGLEN